MSYRRRSPASGGSPYSDRGREDDKTSHFVEKLLESGLLKRLEQKIEQSVERHLGRQNISEGDNTMPSCSSYTVPDSSSRGKPRAGGEILDVFDPDDRNSNVDRWLVKIDELGAIHGWSDYERIYFMQAKLKGAARDWYNHLNTYDLSWTEWQISLSQAFSRQNDYAVLLSELLARNKSSNETMTHYYHAKLALCDRCDMKGEKAVSLIIHGLPENCKASARATRCSTPQELYTKYLSSIDDYDDYQLSKRQSVSSSYSTKSKVPRIAAPPEQAPHSSRSKVQRIAPTRRGDKISRCFNCQELTTHLSRDCPYPRMQRCIVCMRGGHMAAECPEDQRKMAAPRPTSRHSETRHKEGRM